MTKINLTLAVATVALLAAAPAANAVSLGVHGNAGAKVSTPAGGADVSSDTSLSSNSSLHGSGNANAKTGGSASYGTVVSVLASAKGTSMPTDISSATDITIVPLSSLKGKASANAKALAQLTRKRASAISKLDASIAANPQLTAKLSAAGFGATDVLAVRTDASGAVTLFVNG